MAVPRQDMLRQNPEDEKFLSSHPSEEYLKAKHKIDEYQGIGKDSQVHEYVFNLTNQKTMQ